MSEHEIEVIFRKLDNISDQVQQANFILNNNHGTGKKGLVGEFEELKQAFTNFVKQYTIDQAVKKGKDIANKAWWGMIGGAVGAGLTYLVKLIVGLMFK